MEEAAAMSVPDRCASFVQKGRGKQCGASANPFFAVMENWSEEDNIDVELEQSSPISKSMFMVSLVTCAIAATFIGSYVSLVCLCCVAGTHLGVDVHAF